MLVLSLLILALKPVLLPSAAEQTTAHYTFQYDCQNRLSTAMSCASTAYCLLSENQAGGLFTPFGLLISLVYFTLAVWAASAPIKRLLRPPIRPSWSM
ncbi:hypothetical protein DIZ81_05535 [Legionella taurinensis]|uniref:Uncharacterized protein n=2 Tax=Legionella taurinensis TaxID=70611 RepID=A0A3A5LWZ3_9GAMM|nr:hypothetical protein DB744_05535 [Legionella taurinensis]PUT44150.1 hypothetical protein DB746_03935 [Legionella taurinensis]PUT47451.1 hypothetical protein DB743_02105 [Legionella taurinensis]PUT48590.1 hypothetical protein DB745_03935 [Legionella taurinensis]RJT47956.1 hypothetical protein D6J04_05130 [Legionella taurinensis]